MVDILSGQGEDEVIDCAKIANNGESPITYADVDTDFQGNLVPRETTLTDAEDLKTTQSLDYVFQIRRRWQKEKSALKLRELEVVEERRVGNSPRDLAA
jgi:hypothetical protein